MRKNELLQNGDTIIRVLDIKDGAVLVIDCIKRTMPKWYGISDLTGYENCTEWTLSEKTNITPLPMDELDAENRKVAYAHYTMIAGVLPFIGDDTDRCRTVNRLAEYSGKSKQTIRNLLCLYLAYQNISVLAPKKCSYERPLTDDEKNIRWALNKFFYSKNKNSLQTAYTMMLKAKYCDSTGVLLPDYPTIHQFRYFYRKNKRMQTYLISRNGLKDYQRNDRPLVGDGVQTFAPAVGVGMLDSTICDIYLINDAGNLVGRPILTACIDAYSGLCCGYTLSWEGGVYSLRELMNNVIADKMKWCKSFGIGIDSAVWDCNGVLPGMLVTDMGSEYKSGNFEQIADLGVTVVNLPAYRPELKGTVEKFFDLVQGYFKPHLKGKGVIEPDYQERGAHDYRKDACLTMRDFEILILRCLIYYNSQRIIENFPYTDEMITAGVQPYANAIWNWGRKQIGTNLIPVDSQQLTMALLPRTTGKYSRHGLKVNKLRYHCEGYTEQYLKGGSATVAYNPDDVSCVWVIENGCYTKFSLIESRFDGKPLDGVQAMQTAQKQLVRAARADNLQAQINLAEHIKTVTESAVQTDNIKMDSVRATRQKERIKRHADCMKGGDLQ